MTDQNTNIMLDQAFALLDAGQFEPALQVFTQISQQDEGVSEAWLMIGAIQGEIGYIDNAISNIQKAISIDSEYEEAYLTLAQIYTSQNKLVEAAELCEKAVSIDPSYVEAWIKLSGLYGSLDKLEQCERCSLEAIKLSPENAEANVNLANALFGQRKTKEASKAYASALKYSPNLPELHASLGNCWLWMNHNESALKSFQRVLELKRGDADAYCSVAVTYQRLGQFDEAMDNYDKALSIDNSLSRARIAKADLLEQQGDFKTARNLIQNVVDDGDDSIAAAICYSKISRHFSDYDKAIRLLKAATSNKNATADELIGLYNSLGTNYDSTGQYDNAFESFRESNEMQRIEHLHDDSSNDIDKIIRVYSKENLSSFSKSSILSDVPVFIVGMPRSGTSLVEQILASHPDIYGGGELNHIPEFIHNMPRLTGVNGTYPEIASKLTVEVIDKYVETYLNTYQNTAPDIKRLTDKMPHNFLHLGLIQQLFPNAHIIHCLRNPMDNCLSYYFSDFRGLHPYSYDLELLGRHYNDHLRIMSHWKETLDLPILTVQYEDVVADQETQSRKIIDFIGMDWNDQCLRFHETKRHTLTASYDQVRKPMYTKSVERWRNYEKHLKPLIDALGVSVSN